MSDRRGRVLVVDDKPTMLSLVKKILEATYDIETASDGATALKTLASRQFDVVLTDVRMPGADGFEVVRTVKQRWPRTEVVMMTAFASIETAIEAIKQGAYDYLSKPFDPDDVNLVVARALEHKRISERAEALPAAAASAQPFGKVIGESGPMKEVLTLLGNAAGLDVPVLLTGEPGTGKELAAEAIHGKSRRREAPFVPVDCSAVSPDLLERELFEIDGPVRPGASLAQGPLWKRAEGGTLFLNEIDELPASLQISLSRLLDDPTSRPGNVRLMAGSEQDLGVSAKAGRFRAELLSRLGVISIALPPLRVRASDITLLAQHFLSAFAAVHKPGLVGFEPDVLEAFLSYDWPGNVRELRSLVERAAAVAAGARVSMRDLPFELRRGAGATPEADLSSLTYREALSRARDRASREYLIALMWMHDGRVTQAAAGAGIERESLHRLLKRYGVRAETYRDESSSADER